VQQFGMSAIVELLVVLLLVAWEVMGREKRGTVPAMKAVEVTEAKPESEAEALELIEEKPSKMTVVPAPAKKLALPRPERPKLVTSNAAPIGAVARIIGGLLERAEGDRIEIVDLGKAYMAACKLEGKVAVTVNQFGDEVKKFCRKIGIKMKTIDDRLYLLDVKLVEARSQAGAQK
jgi:hypothetical protein